MSEIKNPLDRYVKTLIKEELKFEKILTQASLSKEWDLILDEVTPDIYSWPLLKKEFCNHLISKAEECGDWTQNRHEFYPTNDMLLSDLGMDETYNSILKEYVYPAAIHKWTLEGKTWRNLKFENFIVKYIPEEQSHLSLHHDYSKITAIVTLNENFEGGGTYFERQKFLLKTPTGYVSVHPGCITHRHGARATTKGVRYVIVTFTN